MHSAASISSKMRKYKAIKDLESKLEPIIVQYLETDMLKERDSLKRFVHLFERKIIHAALSATNGNQRIASEILGIGKTTLNEKIKRYTLNLNDYRIDFSRIALMELNQREGEQKNG